MILRGQISKKGNFLQYQPLLFCKLKQIYFQILCPDCGLPLQQCYNDALLEKYGLFPCNELYFSAYYVILYYNSEDVVLCS